LPIPYLLKHIVGIVPSNTPSVMDFTNVVLPAFSNPTIAIYNLIKEFALNPIQKLSK
jgi:hypothetical protein